MEISNNLTIPERKLNSKPESGFTIVIIIGLLHEILKKA